jgi:uncharacterized protein (DUF1330 family)
MPIIEEVGADVLTPPLGVDAALEGDFDPDLAFFIRYPSAEAFDAMWHSDEYGRVAPLRAGALRRGVLTRCAIDPPDADPVVLEPGIAVFNMLWFEPGGRERYDEYLAAAKPLVEAVGGRFVTPRFVPEVAVEGDLRPDLIFIGNYPSRDAVFALVGGADYQEAAAIRSAAVQRSCTTTFAVPG